MSDDTPTRRRSLDSLKKEAKRWLDALRDNAADARARLERALPGVHAKPDTPRRAARARARARLSRMGGAQRVRSRPVATPARKRSRGVRGDGRGAARGLSHRHAGGDGAALPLYVAPAPWQAMRTYVQLDLGKRPSGPDDDVEITLDDARYLVARSSTGSRTGMR